MTGDQIHAFDAVEKLNNLLCKKYEKLNDIDNVPVISITFADHYFFISISIPDEFGGQEYHIYNSENNDRQYNELTDSYEKFETLIRRRFNEIKEELYSIKLPFR